VRSRSPTRPIRPILGALPHEARPTHHIAPPGRVGADGAARNSPTKGRIGRAAGASRRPGSEHPPTGLTLNQSLSLCG
jgi:hypothetical protein